MDLIRLSLSPDPYSRSRELFEKLNGAISVKLGEEYQIGHSYFMNIKNDTDLAFVLKYKIEPLLEEYFYGDTDGFEEIKSYLAFEPNSSFD